MERITTEEMMDKLDMFQSRFGKIDGFGWWYLERISADSGTQIYLHGVSGRMSNPQCLAYVSSSRSSGNEWTSQSDTDNVA